MNNLILVALISGIGSGVAVALLMPQDESGAGSPAASVEGGVDTPAMDKSVQRTVKALEDDLRHLRARVTDLESAEPGAPAKRRVAALRVEPRAAGDDDGAGEGKPRGGPAVSQIVAALESDESPLRTAVQGMINDSMENRRQEWRAVGKAAREARDQDRLKGFFDKVELTEAQSEAMTTAIQAERKRMGDEWRKSRETMQFEGMRQRMRDIRRETDDGFTDVLSDGQLEQWQTYRKENWGRRRRP